MLNKQKVGIVGMGVMGSNLALNIANNGYNVSIFNRSSKRTNEVIIQNPNKKLIPYFSIQDFILSLDRPRCVILMVRSGLSTDQAISSLIPFIDRGDVVIDCGNTFYKDTYDRCNDFLKNGLYFLGVGISGGEEGALKGPSIMPGGHIEGYRIVKPIFTKIAANFEGEPCVTYIGPGGSGHYVKMIHNGIEYGDMQLISEVYFLLKYMFQLNNDQLADIFDNWNSGELCSYLVEITRNILCKKDHEGKYIIDFILDSAENKNTGKWISQSALDLGEPLSVITESVFARYLSSLKQQRVSASKVLTGPSLVFCDNVNKTKFIEKIRKSLYLGKIISYSQGFSQLRVASEKYNWNLQYSKIAKIFRAGCIIRAQLLNNIVDTFFNNQSLFFNLLLTPYFKKIANEYQQDLREVVSYAITLGIPVPALSSAISYYDSYRSHYLPANLIQAQRDYFGAHTYKRLDQDGIFHTRWLL